MAFLYEIRNVVDGTVYVGVTYRDIEKRWAEHRRSFRYSYCDTHLCRAIRKHGLDQFQFIVVDERVSYEDVKQLEIARITELKAKGIRLYNQTEGGDGCLGRTCAVETRMKRREKMLAQGTRKLMEDVDVVFDRLITREPRHFIAAEYEISVGTLIKTMKKHLSADRVEQLLSVPHPNIGSVRPNLSKSKTGQGRKIYAVLEKELGRIHQKNTAGRSILSLAHEYDVPYTNLWNSLNNYRLQFEEIYPCF